MSSSSSPLVSIFVPFVIIAVLQIFQFISFFHASKEVLFAAQNDYELVVVEKDHHQSGEKSSSSNGAEHFLGIMMDNNHEKNSNHNQKLPCYKITGHAPATTTSTKKDTKDSIVIDNKETPVPLSSSHHHDHDHDTIQDSSTTRRTFFRHHTVPTSLRNIANNKRRTAVVVLTYNRPHFLQRTVNSIQRAYLNEQLDGDKFISIDGNDAQTLKTANKIISKSDSGFSLLRHQHVNPPSGLSSTFSLAAHYRFVFEEIFRKRKYENIIIFEDDMDVGFDVFTFFDAFEPVLHQDKSVWCISSWNDNAFEPPFDLSYQKVFRTSYFPGLGWMMKRSLWIDELSLIWPKDNWDHFMRVSTTHKQRSCIVPFVSRNYNFGNEGSTANDDFFNKFLSKVKTTGSVSEVRHWGNAEREEMIEKFYVRSADKKKIKVVVRHDDDDNQEREERPEVMGISYKTYNFDEEGENNNNEDKTIPSTNILKDRIKTETDFDNWIQGQIAMGEVINDASRILRIPSYAVAGTSNKPFVLPYTSENFESQIASKLKSIHPFPRTHYKFVTWFTVGTASSGYVKDVFLVDRRLSPFALDSFKINPDDSLEPVVARSTGISCTQTCADYHGDKNNNVGARDIVYKCDDTQFDFVNSCDVLREFFKDCACQQGWGEDIPNMEAASIHHPPPANCLVTEMKPTCDASHPLTTRLCPCVRA